ncbi:FHA domain-containing serine/threonine-protein kinase [Streptomyces flaveolus]|uniref:FHA domain-containing serine/threonine-protein kinase n=1 Tax=Streptomyces flaveolus TaxID=67297 RepID=A0ABV3AK04_9ACTN|nr:FHA domain-containing serine/threonine-protein kinase [Streptomyces antibioticus]KMS79447.1 serine/threonine protein kinase [Streptomyces regensis]KOG67153.1 serine/threonine protein kinase [Streptomyces antibioticus]
MPSSVTLTPRGAPAASAHVFTHRTTCLVGRASECGIRLARTETKASRHHCLLDINPPYLSVRDLGSRNGTYVNGERLAPGAAGRDLADGDEIRFGGAVLRVSVRAEGPAASHADERDPVDALHTLLDAADAGEPELTGIRGYRLLQELGRGGQGVVHLARNEETGELLALKTLLAHHAVDPSARDGFLREFACTRALRHPHVVAFHGGGVHGSTFYFTCEFCRLGSVADLVARAGGRLSVDQAVGVTLQALRGLHYAHTAEVPVRLADGTSATHRGLVHRDIKPQNLLLTGARDHATVKVADFGLSKAFDSAGLSGHTLTGAMGGSLAFMPRGQVVDFKYALPEVDLWAMTACLYWMLTGSPPRDFPAGADPVAVVLREPVVPIRDRLPTLPRRLAALVDTALVDSPRIALTTAADLASALRQAV